MTRDYYKAGGRKYYKVGSDCVLYHAYWDGTAKDHSKYGNDGTVAGATFVENGLHFDGTDDGVTIADSTDLKPTEAVSVFIWVNSLWEASHSIIHVGDGSGTGGWGIFPWTGDDGGNANLAGYVQHYVTYAAQTGLTTPTSLWGLLALTYDKINVSISVNAGGQNQTACNLSMTYAAGHKLEIGNLFGWYPYHGLIGEVLVFNTFKTTANITDYFNFTSARYGL